jgi:hypothetical protein
MNRRTILRCLSLAGLFAAVGPALAHHGTLVAYDRTKAWTRDATVTGFHFANPTFNRLIRDPAGTAKPAAQPKR